MPSKDNRKQTSYGRFYRIEEVDYPSVTNILGVIGKPALIAWSAKVERELCMEASASLYEDVAETPRMARSAWLTTLQLRMGQEKAHKKELEKAGEIGSQAHAMMEWTLLKKMGREPGPCPAMSDKSTWAFMAWEDFAKMVNLKPLLIEQVIYSEMWGFAGTMDLYATVDLEGLVKWFEKNKPPVPAILIDLLKTKKEATALLDWKTGKAIYSEAELQNAAYRQALREMKHGDPELGLIVRLPKVETDPNFEVKVCPDESKTFEMFLHAMRLWTWAQGKEEEWRKTQEKIDMAKPKEETPVLPKPAAAKAAPSPNVPFMDRPTPRVDGVPPAVIPPAGFGILEKAERSGKAMKIKLRDNSASVILSNNRELKVGKQKHLAFELLEAAVGKRCGFLLADTNVTAILQIGTAEWLEDGTPCIQRAAPPVDEKKYQATDEDVPAF